MKLVNYALQTQIETLGEHKSQEFFKNYIQEILEDESKPYYQKADYVGLSLNDLKHKVDFLSSNIKELQAYKKKLTESLEIAKTLTAEVFSKNGVDRIDGNIISSLTLTKSSQKTKEFLTINNEAEVMAKGYVKFSVDEESILKAMKTKSGLEELDKYVSVNSITETTPAKIKVNTKRSINNTTTTTDEILELEAS
jgi:hypothetical protein